MVELLKTESPDDYRQIFLALHERVRTALDTYCERPAPLRPSGPRPGHDSHPQVRRRNVPGEERRGDEEKVYAEHFA